VLKDNQDKKKARDEEIGNLNPQMVIIESAGSYCKAYSPYQTYCFLLA